MALAILALNGCAAGGPPPAVTAHPDGRGLLASEQDPGANWSFAALVGNQDEPLTFGIRLCAVDPATPPVLTGVTPTSTFGGAPTFVGAKLRTFTPADDHLPAYSAEGFPPDVPDALIDAIGATIDNPCRPAGPGPYTELMIGLQPVPDAGGGWEGELIHYRVGERDYTLETHYMLSFCGPAVELDGC